jgi:hypothetical protein
MASLLLWCVGRGGCSGGDPHPMGAWEAAASSRWRRRRQLRRRPSSCGHVGGGGRGGDFEVEAAAAA